MRALYRHRGTMNPPTAHHTARSWTEPALVLLALIVPGLIPGAVGQGAGAGAYPSATAWLAAGAIQSASQFILLLVIIGRSGRLQDYGAGRPRLADLPRAALMFALTTLLSWLTTTLAAALAAATPVSSIKMNPTSGGPAAFIPPFTADAPAALLALSVLFALAVAYREELLYRLYIPGVLRERGSSRVTAIAISSLLFAAGHGWQGLAGTASALLIGVVMAGAASRGWGLHSLAAAHAAYDICVLLAIFLPPG